MTSGLPRAASHRRRRIRWQRALIVTVVTAGVLAASVVPAGLSTAGATTTTGGTRQTVVPGLEHRTLSLRLDDGSPAVADVLAFHPGDPALDLRPELAHGQIPGTEPLNAMGRRLLDQGGVAGINASFTPPHQQPGDPDGFYAERGHLESEAQTRGGGPRGALATLPEGPVLMDRLDTAQTVTLGPRKEALTGINRAYSDHGPHPDGSAPVFLYTPRFGEAVDVRRIRPGSPVQAFTLRGVQPPLSGASRGRVAAVHPGEGPVAIPPRGGVVVAHGAAAERLAGVTPGQPAAAEVAVQPASDDPGRWAQAVNGVAGGPLIVKNGQMTDPESWFEEGFSPRTHTHARHPRSAIGWTGDGTVLLVTVDGRQPGRSVGMTMHELADLLRQLGAVRGLSLDGGASTQMAVNGQLVNQPCCETPLRGAVSGLFVHYSDELPHTACPADQVPDAGFADTAGNAHGRAVNCVAWYDVARGTSADTYAPGQLVRRDQMASFLVRLLAASGVQVPPPRDQGFADIDGNAHADRIRQLAALGITRGTGPGTYSPERRVRRDQMASFLVRAYERISGAALDSPPSGFGDIAGNPHAQAIAKSRAAGFTRGLSGTTYAPARRVRRDQMASFLARTLTLGFADGHVTHPAPADRQPGPEQPEPAPEPPPEEPEPTPDDGLPDLPLL